MHKAMFPIMVHAVAQQELLFIVQRPFILHERSGQRRARSAFAGGHGVIIVLGGTICNTREQVMPRTEFVRPVDLREENALLCAE